jgi:hypothetical protein
MTLMGFEHPDMIRILQCAFNRQVHPIHGITCKNKVKIQHLHGVI